ncbi:MAG: HAMP domain-containing protein [Bacteroidales bacterium]|nr:HAMP domain-containing protein [Bacteroidales bacterium]
MKPAAEGFSSKKIGKSLIIHYLKFHSSIYSRVILIIALLSVFLLISFSVIFSSVNEKYLNSIIHQNGRNIGSIVEGALYHSMLRNDKSELHNTLDIINSLSGIDEVNLYDNNDSLVYSSYAADATHKNNPDCIKCHRNLNALFSWPDKTYRIINVKSACSMYAQENKDRFLLIRSKIMNERSCYTNACHAHGEDDIMLGSLIIKMPLAEFDKAVDQSSTRYFVFAILATVLLSSLLVVFTRKNIKKPLHDLVDASMAVTRGDRDKRLNTKHNQLDDMRMVSLAFNQMLDKLQAANTELENWSKQLEYKVQKKSEELSSVQNELIQIERIASLGKLSASVAHELNNPLSGILVYAKLISKQLAHKDLDETRKETMLKHLKLIENETKRCGDIVRGLLDFSRKDQSDYEPSHLHDVLRETYELMNHQMKIAGLGFILHNTAREDLISCSPNQMKQACVALLVNAVEAVGPNGEIVMKTSNPDEQSVKLEIIDDGKGIAPENMPHIFEPFFSTKHEASGIGLGLAIVHGIVQSHKGSINVVSEPGKGTTIAITIPLIRNKED